MDKYHLRFRSLDPAKFLSVDKIIKGFVQKSEELDLKGPIPLPKKRKLFTVNRSHHVHKKSRDQYELLYFSRLWVLEATPRFNFAGLQRDLLKELRGLEGISYDWSYLR